MQDNSFVLHTCKYSETDSIPSILFYINIFSGARVIIAFNGLLLNFDDRMFKTCSCFNSKDICDITDSYEHAEQRSIGWWKISPTLLRIALFCNWRKTRLGVTASVFAYLPSWSRDVLHLRWVLFVLIKKHLKNTCNLPVITTTYL